MAKSKTKYNADVAKIKDLCAKKDEIKKKEQLKGSKKTASLMRRY